MLIDKIGYLDDAIKEAHDQAELGDDWMAITYERPSLLSQLLTGGKGQDSAGLDAAKLADAAPPRRRAWGTWRPSRSWPAC